MKTVLAWALLLAALAAGCSDPAPAPEAAPDAEAQAAIEALRSEVAALRAESAATPADAADPGTRAAIEAIRSENMALRADTGAIRSENVALRSEIEALRFEVGAIRSQLEALGAQPDTPTSPVPGPTARPDVPQQATGDAASIWPELRVDGLLSQECQSQLMSHTEFSGTLAEVEEAKSRVQGILETPYSRLTEGLLYDIDNWIDGLAYETGYTLDWDGVAYGSTHDGKRQTPSTPPHASHEFRCANDREALTLFHRARMNNPMWAFRETVLNDYWNCIEARKRLDTAQPEDRPYLAPQIEECDRQAKWWPPEWLPGDW